MKQILVTGASKGIGKAVSLNLLKKGYSVLGLARSFQDIFWEGSSFTPYEIDFKEIRKMPDHLKNLIKTFPDLDSLILNAGFGKFGHLEQFSFEEISDMFHVNFLSQVFLVKAFLPLLKKKEEGHFIFMGSEASFQGKKKGSIYCATKASLKSFKEALREECTTSGIRVSIIHPGMVKTSFFEKLSFSPGEKEDEHLKEEDVAECVSFILSLRKGVVIDEISLSSQKRNIQFL